MSKQHVLCTIPTATSPINGIEFEEHPEGLISADPLDEDDVAYFVSIPGYSAVPAKIAPQASQVPADGAHQHAPKVPPAASSKAKTKRGK